MAEARPGTYCEEESIQSVGTEEKKVIFASSLGTVFEWYDFYLYAMLAPFFAALFFPPGNETAALLSAFATYAAGFLVRPFGALVFGRIGDLVGRKYTFLVTIVFMGAHFAGRPAADLRDDRLARADPAGHAAARAGPRARRRVRRRGDLRRRARAARQARLRHQLDPDHRDAGLLPGAAGHRSAAARDMDAEEFADWGWRIPFLALARPAGVLHLHPAQAARVAGLPEDEGRGQRLEVAAARQLPASIRTTSTCCSRCSARPPARASSGTRASSTRCSSSPITLKLDYVLGLHADRRRRCCSARRSSSSSAGCRTGSGG